MNQLNMLDLIVREYIAIVEKLEHKNEVEKERIVIEREDFKNMLERYAFATFKYKTIVYKDLNFIIHDNESYTMPYKDKELKKTVRKVIINYRAYLTIKRLYNIPVNL